MNDQLEALIDAHGIGHVLDTLAEICAAKADHIRSNWQDESLARAWDAMGRAIEAGSAKSVKLLGRERS